jgi:AcrR family transcriptional regulator
MTSPGQPGARRTQKRQAILYATERVMLDEGYAAVTFRNVAAAADVTPGLVQYYFPSVDKLFEAVLHQSTDRIVAELGAATRSDYPLRAVWAYANDRRGANLLMEFLALANHRQELRSVLVAGGERLRQALLAAVMARWGSDGCDHRGVPAPAALFLLAWIPRIVLLEESLGTLTGHAETLALVESFLNDVEPLEP